MSVSVSELGQLNYVNTMLSSQRNQLDTLQDQISSGEKASLYSGLGGAGAVRSISLHSALSQMDTYSTNISVVRGRTSIMDTALNSLVATAQGVSNDLLTVTQNNIDPGMLNFNVEAQGALNQIQAYLNSSYNGQQVFAGTDLNTQPVASLSTLNTNVTTQLAALYSGASTGATVLTAVAGITGVNAGYSASLAAAGNVTAQIDSNQTIDYTVKADDPAIQQVMQGLSIIANLQYDPAHPTEFWNVYNGAKAMIDQGARGVTNLDSKVGLVQKQLEQTDTTHQLTQNTLEIQLGDVEHVDIAQATTQLQLLQTQLQASYKVVSMVNQLSLVNFL